METDCFMGAHGFLWGTAAAALGQTEETRHTMLWMHYAQHPVVSLVVSDYVDLPAIKKN